MEDQVRAAIVEVLKRQSELDSSELEVSVWPDRIVVNGPIDVAALTMAVIAALTMAVIGSIAGGP